VWFVSFVNNVPLISSQELLDRIIEVVHKVPGVSKVHSEIVVATSLYAGRNAAYENRIHEKQQKAA
jgi:hypothetical protein